MLVKNKEIEAVEETLSLRRTQLTESIKEGISSLLELHVQPDKQDEQSSKNFAVQMSLSEIYRTIAYWESHLFQVVQTIREHGQDTK